jgi:hypothetical protein
MTVDQPAQNLRLPRRAKYGLARLALGRCDALDRLGPAHEKIVHRLVQTVDLAPELRQGG